MNDPIIHPQFARELREELAKNTALLNRNLQMTVEILHRIDPSFPSHSQEDLDEWYEKAYDYYVDVEGKISEHFPMPQQDSMYHLIVSLHAQSEIWSRLLTRALVRLRRNDQEEPPE